MRRSYHHVLPTVPAVAFRVPVGTGVGVGVSANIGPETFRNRRRGISLLEILISIGIMGIGMIALATLFPLALLRVKSATDSTRSVFIAQSAESEILARDLLDLNSFMRPWYWYTDPANPAQPPRYPFVQDTDPTTGYQGASVYRGLRYDPSFGTLPSLPGPGLPVAYDPLWWGFMRETDPTMNPAQPNLGGFLTQVQVETDARFGNGTGLIRSQNSSSNPASVAGLQRLTNFVAYDPNSLARYWPFTFPTAANPGQNVAAEVFVAPEDMVYQKEGESAAGTYTDGVGSPVVPDFSSGAAARNWIFSWMLTGQTADSGSMSIFNANIVVHRNRIFGNQPVATLNGGTRNIPLGERVVEAVFGYTQSPPVGSVYGQGDPRVIQIRWPVGDAQGEPEVRVGGWIADVTYQRSLVDDYQMYRNALSRYPGQRCHWYQITKRSEVEADLLDPTGYRRMIITVNTPVRAKTRWVGTAGPNNANEWLVEAALIMPSVINVFPRTFTIR